MLSVIAFQSRDLARDRGEGSGVKMFDAEERFYVGHNISAFRPESVRLLNRSEMSYFFH